MSIRFLIVSIIIFIGVVFAAIAFDRWINPRPTVPPEYKQEMEKQREAVNAVVENAKANDKSVKIIDRLIKVQEQRELQYQTILNTNNAKIKIIQQMYEKNNHIDTFNVADVTKYVTEY